MATSNEKDDLKEYLLIQEKALKDTFNLKHVIRKILKKYKIAPSEETERIDSRSSAERKSVLDENINIMNEDLQKLLQHLKEKKQFS